jgi:uncharacterized membrane protein YkvA (DUF1232 family)
MVGKTGEFRGRAARSKTTRPADGWLVRVWLSGNGMIISTLDRWKGRVKQLKTETYALYLAYRDPRVRWYARVFIACVVAYAFSPIDLVPDFIPILGYLDDLMLIPLGIKLALRMIPAAVLDECREKARATMLTRRRDWRAGSVIIAIWLLLLTLLAVVIVRVIRG